MLNKEELKKLFENGDIPRQEDFWEWQASYFHKEDSIPPENIAYDFTRKADLVDGKVPASQLPSYVDDVLEFGSYAELPQPGEKGKIYITTGDNKQYRWGGSSYVGIDNTQLGNYIPYEGADRTVSLNSQNLHDIKHFYSHSGIQDGTMGLSVINDAVGGFKSNLLIRVSAVAGNMLTFTVKLYSYPYEFYEFQINLYRYQENHYEPTVNWKSGESTHIGKIEFYKDPASGDFYVLILGSQLGIFAYPRVAITDLQAYLGDQTFNKDHWKLEWDADASSLVLQATTLSEYFKKDSRAVTTHTDQAISGSKTFKRDLNLTDDGLGINFEAGNKIYKKAGSGITLKKGSSNQNPRVENNDGTKSWEIIHEGNLQNIVSGNNGWGGNFNNITDPNITHKSGFFGADPNGNLPESYYTAWINVNAWAEHDNYGFQLASPLFGDNMYFRKYRSTGYDQKNHTDWYKLWTSNNFNPNDYWGKRDMGIYRAITTNKPLGILNENNQAQRLLAGGLLLSDGYVDESLVPHLGIYSKGDINTPGTVISDKFSSSKLNGSQIINASNADQLYIGNPIVDTVYHESGNNHIFTSKGNPGLTVDSNGNIKARNAVNAGNDSEIGGRIFGKRTMIDTLGLDESKYYPVTIQCNRSYPSTIKVYRTLDSSMGVPSYSTHGGGFWCYYEFEVYGNGWGTTQFKAICNYQDESWVKDDTKVIGYDQMIYSSNVVIYVKGGSKYWFDVNSTSIPTLHTSPYTVYGQTAEPIEARIWSGGILMNANTNDIRNAVNDLGSTLKDYVTLATPQRIDGKKTFGTSYDSYTSDGLFDSGAKPLSTVTPSGKSLLLGYRDFGGGQYYPRLGFTSDQTWSLGPIGNDFTIGMSNNDSHILKLNSDSSSELSNIKFLPFHGGTWIDMPSSGISGMGSGGPGVNAWLAMPKAAGEFFSNAEPGDLISRNQGKKIMWGNDATDAGMYLANNILHLKNNINIQGNDAWHTGNLEDYHNYGLGGTISPIVNDLSGFNYTSFYRITPDTSGRPFDYGTVLNQMYQGDELTQLSIDITTGKLQTRARNSNNGFTLWQKYITDGIEVDSKAGINNGSAERSNKVWFDYNWAGTGGSGSVINFSGLNGNYSTELFSEYNGNHVGIRTHNGDNNTWSLHKWLWHSDNFNPANYLAIADTTKFIFGDNATGTSNAYPPDFGQPENTFSPKKSGFYRPNNDNYYGALLIWVNHPGYSNGAYGAGLAFDYGGGEVFLTGKDGNGVKLTPKKIWHSNNFNPDSKVNTQEKASALGFGSGMSSNAPYIVHSTDGPVNLATQNWVKNNFITTDTSSQTKAGNLALAAGATFKVSGVDNNHIQSYNESTGNAGVVSAWVHSHYATRWKVGNKRGGNTESLGYAFHFSDDNGATYNEKVLIQPDSNIVTANFGTASAWYQAYNWGNHANAGYATQNYVSQNYIPKSHPVNNINAANIDTWNNAISQSSASEEIILEDGQLAVQPDEFSLKGSSSYDIASRRKLVHVLFREGNELNIGKIRRRQTFVIFNFEKASVSINIEGLKPYLLAAANKITLYIDDEGEVLMFDQNNFKKLG